MIEFPEPASDLPFSSMSPLSTLITSLRAPLVSKYVRIKVAHFLRVHTGQAISGKGYVVSISITFSTNGTCRAHPGRFGRSTHERVWKRPEPSGIQQCPEEVVTRIPEHERCATHVFKPAAGHLRWPVPCAGPLERCFHINVALRN